eukprot:259359-Chlamydomonas_euryale.AAC.3
MALCNIHAVGWGGECQLRNAWSASCRCSHAAVTSCRSLAQLVQSGSQMSTGQPCRGVTCANTANATARWYGSIMCLTLHKMTQDYSASIPRQSGVTLMAGKTFQRQLVPSIKLVTSHGHTVPAICGSRRCQRFAISGQLRLLRGTPQHQPTPVGRSDKK